MSAADLKAMRPDYRDALAERLGEIRARNQLSLLWTIQSALAGLKDAGARNYEHQLVEIAFAHNDEAHKAALDAIGRKYHV